MSQHRSSTMRHLHGLLLCLLFLAILITNNTHAQGIIGIDLQGYAWEETINESELVDLSLVLIADQASKEFGADLSSVELTFWITGMTPVLQQELDPGVLSVFYAGGAIRAFVDTTVDHDYGITPQRNRPEQLYQRRAVARSYDHAVCLVCGHKQPRRQRRVRL